MGISAIWVGPLYKQVAFQATYHGYGIQNFLEIDEHFGTIADLVEMVATAHQNGIYVIMDIILNHTGHVFSYEPDVCLYQDEKGRFPRWNGRPFPVKGFNNAAGVPDIPFRSGIPASSVGLNDAVWPREFQDPAVFTQKGRMIDPDNYPEYIEGDFEHLKDIHLGTGSINHYTPSPALKFLCEVYKYWIALTDLDGFRIDTVKHMDKGAVRYFASCIHEFTQSIGKENFYLIGEISGPRAYAYHTLEKTGLNAALGLDGVQDKMEYLVKGERSPHEYFDLFTNSLQVGKESHAWFRNKVVTSFDDHDQIRKGKYKARFCASLDPTIAQPLMLNVLALNAFSLGIPCIYYGSEQCLDGEGGSDQYIREAMFGGEFGPFRSRFRHCFNEGGWVYQELARILRIRRESMALRRGRQYLRPISANGVDFGYPVKREERLRSIVAWSRIFVNDEFVLAFNTDTDNPIRAWVTVDADLHSADEAFVCIYCSNDKGMIGKNTPIENRNGKAIAIALPAAGFCIYKKADR